MSLNSFKNAFCGISAAFVGGCTFRIMLICFPAVIIASIISGLSYLEWAVILVCCAGVLSLEMINTAIESAVNLATAEYRPLAKKAKDVAAGAVLLFSIFSAAVGLLIFIPHIIQLISGG